MTAHDLVEAPAAANWSGAAGAPPESSPPDASPAADAQPLFPAPPAAADRPRVASEPSDWVSSIFGSQPQVEAPAAAPEPADQAAPIQSGLSSGAAPTPAPAPSAPVQLPSAPDVPAQSGSTAQPVLDQPAVRPGGLPPVQSDRLASLVLGGGADQPSRSEAWRPVMPPRSDAHSGLAGPLSGGPGTGDLALGAPAGMGAGSASPQIDVEPPASPVPAADPANPAGPAWLTPVGVGPDRPQSELPAWALSVNDRLGSDRFDPVPPTTAPAGSVGSSSDSAADSPAALPTDSSAVGAPPLTVVSLPSAPLTMVSLPEAPPASTAPEQDWSAEPLGGSAEPDAAGPPAESATDWSALSFLDPADSDGSDLYPLTGATAPDRPEADQAGSGPAADSDPTASDLAADSDQADPSVAPPEEPVGETTLRLSEILPDSQGKGSALFGISDDVTAGLSPEMLDSAAEMGAALETSPPPAPPVWSQPASAPVATNLSQSTPQPSPIPDDLFRTRRIPSVAQVAAAAAAAAAEAVESSGDWGRLSTSPAKPPVGGDGGPRPPASTAAPAEDGAEPKRGRGALLAGIAAILIGLGLLAGLVVYLYSVWSPSDDPTPLPPPPTLPSVSPKPTPTVTPSQTPSSTPTVTPTATPTALTGKIPAEAHQACNTERTLGTASTQSTCAFAEVVAGNIPAGSRGEFTIQATAPSNNVTYTLQCSTLDVYYRCESTTGAVYFVVFR